MGEIDITVCSRRYFCQQWLINSTMPTIYTRINSYVSWIYNNTRDACYCSYPLTFGF